VDNSTVMDAKLTLGNDTFTHREFCHNQLEIVLKGLPNGTYFNVIEYSSFTGKIFQKPVLVNKANIDAAMEAVTRTWRSNYTPGQDPTEMHRNIKAFALNFKYQLNPSTKTNSMEALQLAYATAALTSQQKGDWQDRSHELEGLFVSTNSPQIYFLASGQLDGGSHQILNNIKVVDNGRNMPVNSIAFMMPDDSEAKQFVKDLANRTGGFFRSIEQAS